MLALAIPAVAANEPKEIVKGTAVVDGLLDDAYLNSAKHVIRNLYVWSWGSFKQGDVMPSGGTVYFLWDENYLYVCGVVQDSTPTSAGDTEWQNDALEHVFNDTHDSGMELSFRFSHAADGVVQLGDDLSGMATFELEDGVYASTYTEDGYIVEAAFPLPNMGVGKTFDYSVQLNDIWEPDHPDGYAKGSTDRDISFICVEEKGSSPTTATTAETRPAEGQTTTVAPDIDNAQNNDLVVYISIAVVAVAAIAAVIIVVTVKSKRKGK